MAAHATVWAIVVAGGSGTRFGAPKQWTSLAGRSVCDWSVAAARAACDAVVLVVPGADVGRPDLPAADAVVAGGATRSASVRAGLGAVPADVEVVVVHDAARPVAGPALFAAAVAAVGSGADGAICAVPVSDTVKRVDGDLVVDTVDRAGLWAVQTPQAFRAAALRAAHAAGGEATDDAALVEAAGGRVVVVPGARENLKVTEPVDLLVAAALLA